ncbi:unnamed protein product [Brachionus calyciflorus]|uniref:Uncharacterized protein n=1 Tax=Brachionus calyciflorus TaxID=104777 RepID=A0A814EDM2_9BILA|nr:unnamed protein product [Brachionus calyciflorus]
MKHAEADRKNWPKYLSLVLMAYRSRVYTSTGNTAFDSMLGRKILLCKESTTEENDVEALLVRTNEIRPIRNYQEKQIEIQNNSQNTINERIPIGTTVYLKCEGLLRKLKPKFEGPYKIINRPKEGIIKRKMR